MKYLFLLFILSFQLLANDTYNDRYEYKKCQFNTNKNFQVGFHVDNKLPRIFNFDEKINTLTANSDHTAISNFDADSGEYIFEKTSKVKTGVYGFRKKTDPPGTKYHFKVQKDDKDRIIAITKYDKNNDSSKTVTFEFSDNKCVPATVYETSGNKHQVQADIITCRTLAKRYKDLFKKIDDTKECMKELGSMHKDLLETTDELLKRAKKYKINGLKKLSYHPETIDNLEKMSDMTKELLKTVKNKAQEEDKEEELSKAFTRIQNHCFQHFTDDILYSKKEFDVNNKGIYTIDDKVKLSPSNQDNSAEVNKE